MTSDDPGSGVEEQKALDRSEVELKTVAEQEEDQSAKDFKQAATKSGQPSMHVKVYSPFRDYYDGQAFSISAENSTGPFDILPKHHNFISLLSACQLSIRSVSQDSAVPTKINIGGGLMHVKKDEVLVFLDV